MRPAIPLASFEVFAEGLDHPEGLAFDRDGNLWAGGELGQVYRIDSQGRSKEVACIGGFNLGVTISPGQDLFICNFKKHALVQMDRRGKVLTSWDRCGGYRFRTPNFSVFDSEGNLYFTDSGEWQRNDGLVFVLRPNGRVERFAGPFAFANGLSLSADERELFVVESTANRVRKVAIGPDGTAGGQSVFGSGLDSVPDGCAFDINGNLYVTCYASHNVYRLNRQGKLSLLAEDPCGTMIASPTNAAFRDGYVYFANLSRWHICRAKVGLEGQPLVGER